MQFATDLHLHSKYSRAVSPHMNLSEMARVGRLKGIDILSAADFTHPLWFKELSTQLTEAKEGLYQLKSQITPHPNPLPQGERELREQYFFLSTEIASIYKQGEKLRRIHSLVFVPNLGIAKKVSDALLKKGANLAADGRPIIGLSSKQLLELILEIDDRCMLIPCHVWTPHFGLYGSASGFDSIEESFGELSQYIYGIETGLSSDPEMNWTISELKNRSILSFSDAHSAPKMGREATVFELTEPTYENIRRAIMNPFVISRKYDERSPEISPRQPADRNDKKNRVVYTIEFYPEEGKYHFSGHRSCKVVFTPEETKEKKDMCPVCHRKLTEGVFNRVQQLSDASLTNIVTIRKNDYGLQWFTDPTHQHPPYVKLVPLLEICAESLEASVLSQKVKDLYMKTCRSLGDEFTILLKTPIGDIKKTGGEKLAEGIQRVRSGEIAIQPGFDGEYGKVAIFAEKKEEITDEVNAQQQTLL